MRGQSGSRARGRDDGQHELVGRDIDVAALADALASAKDGRPRFLLLSGRAGIGKSRLIHELAGQARKAAVPVGIGRGHYGLQVPYLPLCDALRAVSANGATGTDPLIDLLNVGSSSLARLGSMAAAGNGMPPAPPANDLPGAGIVSLPDRPTAAVAMPQTWVETLDAARGVEELYRNVLDHALARLERGPLVLVIEDVHWVDAATLDLLGYLLASLNDVAIARPVPLLVVLTYRPEVDGAARRFFSRAARQPLADRLELVALDGAQTRALIEALGVPRPAQALVDAIQSATRGNPLFIETVVGDLERSGALENVAGHTIGHTSSEALRLPDDLEEAIARNLDGLSDAARHTLGTAALLGDAFSAAALAAIVGEKEGAVLGWLEEAVGLLDDADGGHRFSQPLVQQALTSRMRPVERRRAHARIAAFLDEPSPVEAGERGAVSAWERAHHLMLAGSEVNPATTHAACRQAAVEAAQVFAWDNAATAWIGAARTATALPERADFHLEAALCYHNAWDWGPCVEQFEAALQLYRNLDDDVGVARVLASRARSRLPANVYGEALDTEPLEAAISALGEREPALRGLLHSRIADAHWNARQWGQCRDSANEALRLAAQAGDERLASVAAVPLALADYQSVQLAKAGETFRESIRYAEGTGLLWLENVPRQRLVHILQLRGELQEAAREHARAIAQTQQTGDLGEMSFALASAAAQAVIEGDLEGVESIVRDALNAVERSRYPFSGLFAIMTLSYARFLTGRWNDAKDALLQIQTPGAVFDEPGRAVLGLARAIRDFIDGTASAWTDTEDSLAKRRTRLLRQAQGIAQLGQDVTALGMGCILVEHAAEAQVHEAAQILLPPLAKAFEAGLIFAPGWPVLVPRVLGLGHILLGQEEAGRNALLKANELALAAGARSELARARLGLAQLLAASQQADEQAQARRLLDLAYADFVALALAPFARQAEALAHGLGLRLEPDQASGLADRADVALLRGLGAGRDAGALEAELLLSRATVEQRLADLGARLDTDTTAETIAEAIDRRIVAAPAMPRVPATFMATDIVGFTSTLERLGDERAQILAQAHNRLLRGLARDHGAREVSYTGDGFILAFRAAPEAVACAVATQRALLAFNARPEQEPIAVRMGLEAGEPLLDEERLFGRALVAAVRICGQAQGGQILISEAVRGLTIAMPEAFSDVGMHQLKGFRDPVRLYEVGWEDNS